VVRAAVRESSLQSIRSMSIVDPMSQFSVRVARVLVILLATSVA